MDCRVCGVAKSDTTEGLSLHFRHLYPSFLAQLSYNFKRTVVFFFSPMKMIHYFLKLKVTQLCPTLCIPTDWTVLGILQARILEWVAYSFSRGIFPTRIQPVSPALQADSLPTELSGHAYIYMTEAPCHTPETITTL